MTPCQVHSDPASEGEHNFCKLSGFPQVNPESETRTVPYDIMLINSAQHAILVRQSSTHRSVLT